MVIQTILYLTRGSSRLNFRRTTEFRQYWILIWLAKVLRGGPVFSKTVCNWWQCGQTEQWSTITETQGPIQKMLSNWRAGHQNASLEHLTQTAESLLHLREHNSQRQEISYSEDELYPRRRTLRNPWPQNNIVLKLDKQSRFPKNRKITISTPHTARWKPRLAPPTSSLP